MRRTPRRRRSPAFLLPCPPSAPGGTGDPAAGGSDSVRMNTRRWMPAPRSECRASACVFAAVPCARDGYTRRPFFACERMRFPRPRHRCITDIVMVEGRFGLFAAGCREGRRACAVLRNRGCAAPDIPGSLEALRQSAYTFADRPAMRATCVAAFRSVRVDQHRPCIKHLVSRAFSSRASVVHA